MQGAITGETRQNNRVKRARQGKCALIGSAARKVKAAEHEREGGTAPSALPVYRPLFRPRRFLMQNAKPGRVRTGAYFVRM
jgi:hypothetical protein